MELDSEVRASRHPHDLAGRLLLLRNQAAIRAFAVDDDAMATPANCERFLYEYYCNAPATFSSLRASDAPRVALDSSDT
jgi:predicted alpha/beta hydrolase